MITAGGAGMFCGSCMHDNTWARGLQARGVEVTLIPTYTPIRVDEQDAATNAIYFGGINVYLDYRFPLWRKIPRPLTRWLDSKHVLSVATKFAVSNSALHLGPLTIAMLEGESGPEKTHVNELADFLGNGLQPDAICFSNALLVGALRAVKQKYKGAVFCTLQGDDIFLEALPEPHRTRALDLLRERAREFDGFFVHSAYYRDFMADYLDLPREKFHLVPLGIDLAGHDGKPKPARDDEFVVGYFARIDPAKGLHQLVDAFEIFHAKHPRTRLRVGGYLGKDHQRYFRDIVNRCRKFGGAFEYAGSPATHAEKVELIKSFDVLSVPTVYREPKGLYVLEALANGVPAVQPRHGAFPEMIEETKGGLLVEPGDPESLARGLETMLLNPAERMTYAAAGHAHVHTRLHSAALAEATLDVLRKVVHMRPQWRNSPTLEKVPAQ